MKAPGDDGLNSYGVEQVWPVVNERALLLFKRCTYADPNSTVADLRGPVYQLGI